MSADSRGEVGGFVAIIRDEGGSGVRADCVEGWEPGHYGKTRVTLTTGVIYLQIPVSEFVQRLDRALTPPTTDETRQP